MGLIALPHRLVSWTDGSKVTYNLCLLTVLFYWFPLVAGLLNQLNCSLVWMKRGLLSHLHLDNVILLYLCRFLFAIGLLVSLVW